MHFLVMLVLLVPLLMALKKGYINGLAVAAFYWVSTPSELRLPLPGGLPQFTFHRMLVIIMLCAYFATKSRRPQNTGSVLGGKIMVWLSVSYVISFIFSESKDVTFKATLAYLVEIVVFYFMMAKSLQSKEDLMRIVKALTFGLITVACFTWIEKYKSVNYFESILGYNVGDVGDITASYRHRILLGYAMAMAIPLVAIQLRHVTTSKQKWFFCIALCVVAAACYFPRSRGPWLGAVIATGCLFMLGDAKSRKALKWLAIGGALVMILRPGVWETIGNLLGDTDAESQKGRSYNYRWELWGAAFKTIAVSPIKLGFGYGALSHETMDLSHLLTMGGNIKKLGYTSFDNNYAAFLLELGLIGLALTMSLYASICRKIFAFRSWLNADDRMINGALFSSILVYLFAMTNVYIFAPQLDFLFWTLVACVAALARHAANTKNNPDPEASQPARI